MSDQTVPTERAALAEALRSAGADAPTLCEGWQAVDLVAHLVVREHQPLAGLGIVASPLAGFHDSAITRAKRRRGFDALVDRFASGPPLLWRPIDHSANLAEFFVHHEDLRRGDGATGPRPEAEVAELEEALWAALSRSAKFMSRGLKPAEVLLVRPDGDHLEARQGGPTLTVTGRPGELMLWLFGRRDAAQVELSGDEEALDIAERASLGI